MNSFKTNICDVGLVVFPLSVGGRCLPIANKGPARLEFLRCIACKGSAHHYLFVDFGFSFDFNHKEISPNRMAFCKLTSGIKACHCCTVALCLRTSKRYFSHIILYSNNNIYTEEYRTFATNDRGEYDWTSLVPIKFTDITALLRHYPVCATVQLLPYMTNPPPPRHTFGRQPCSAHRRGLRLVYNFITHHAAADSR